MEPCLLPEAGWQWQFIPDKQQFILHTKHQEPFVTAFKTKQLMLNNAMTEPFTLEHTAAFHEFSELLQHRMAGVPEPVLWHICIHAIAARFYHKAVVNKSYWFVKNEAQPEALSCSYATHNFSPLVAFDTQLGQCFETPSGCGLILSRDGSFATLLLLSSSLDVTSDKRLPRYTALKTHQNTLRDASLEELARLF